LAAGGDENTEKENSSELLMASEGAWTEVNRQLEQSTSTHRVEHAADGTADVTSGTDSERVSIKTAAGDKQANSTFVGISGDTARRQAVEVLGDIDPFKMCRDDEEEDNGADLQLTNGEFASTPTVDTATPLSMNDKVIDLCMMCVIIIIIIIIIIVYLRLSNATENIRYKK